MARLLGQVTEASLPITSPLLLLWMEYSQISIAFPIWSRPLSAEAERQRRAKGTPRKAAWTSREVLPRNRPHRVVETEGWERTQTGAWGTRHVECARNRHWSTRREKPEWPHQPHVHLALDSAGITFVGFYFVLLKQPGFWPPPWAPERGKKRNKNT